MIWLFCLTLLFAQQPQQQPAQGAQSANAPQEDELPPDPLADNPEAEPALDEHSGSLVKRLTEPFNYERENKRDPFLLPAAKEAPLLPGSYFGPFLPLQELKLADVVIKGIIMDRVKPKAILQMSDAKGKPMLLRIGIGDYLGENCGVVQAIRDGKVIVVQTLGEGDKKSTSTVVLTIRPSTKGQTP
ncbi:MAG: pilus assembly protein PilP [Bdellovibrionaceae bacterium]|nr:pilus assembly protein PilP [Pseudobdellovibrionaceae bacterium]